MSKAMRIQVLAFESVNEVNILISGVNKVINSDHFSDSARQTAKEIRDELIKINTVFEATNNN